MGIKELKETLEKRRIFLERKLESKKLPHCNGVNPNIIIETEAKLEEVEKILDLLSNESFINSGTKMTVKRYRLLYNYII